MGPWTVVAWALAAVIVIAVLIFLFRLVGAA